jgi:PhzF family phenazine biosynthesis protein
VDAFTDTLFGGNPAGVVTNADGLSEKEMSQIAREMNLSETSFVFKPITIDADVKLRYFTPASEVKFCGHATIAALFQLARLQMYGLSEKQSSIRIETNAGLLDSLVSHGNDDQPRITFTAPKVSMDLYHLQGKAFAEAFGIPVNVLLGNGEILIDPELNYVYIPIRSLEQLGNLRFDFSQIHSQFGSENIVIFCLFTNETKKEDSHIHARGLAPLVGVDEDPFTGSMQAGLTYAAKHNNLLKLTQQRIIIEQGNFIGCPGFALDNIQVTASAVQVFSTKLEI